MNKPMEFTNNLLSYQEVREVLTHYKDIIRWRSDGKDSLLDIGCGSGFIAHELLIPYLPSTFKRIVGCDTSEVNIAYAKANYHHPKLTFTIFDIETEDSDNYNDADYDDYDDSKDSAIATYGNLGGKFDHITAFFVLNCTQRPYKVLTHIHQLLKLRGDCLLITIVQLPLYDAYLRLSVTKKWKKYMCDVERFISVYHNRRHKDIEFEMTFLEAGFLEHIQTMHDGVYTIDGLENARNAIAAVNPMLNRVPAELKSEFTDDIIKAMLDCPGVEKVDFNDPNFKLTYTYTLIVAYGRI